MIRVRDIECGNCGNSELKSGDVDVLSESAADIECPRCDSTTKIRQSASEIDPRKF